MGSHITSTSWCRLISLSLGVANPAAGQVDQQRAEAYFKEAAAICQRDGGRLWGVSLCGPIVIADARTGTIATSEPAPAAERPRTFGFANAPVEWGGSRWVALVWDFTASLPDASTRGELMFGSVLPKDPYGGNFASAGGGDLPTPFDSKGRGSDARRK